MSTKETVCTISQYIYDDVLQSFEAKGCLGKLYGSSLSVSPRVFFVCRFPSMIRTDLFCSNLHRRRWGWLCFCCSVWQATSVSVVIYGIQNHLQEKILQLFHSDSNLRQVLLFHECFFSATCVDLTIGVCTSLRRHLSRIHKIYRYKNFDFAQVGRKRPVTKGTYFIALGAVHNTGSFESLLALCRICWNLALFQRSPQHPSTSSNYSSARGLSFQTFQTRGPPAHRAWCHWSLLHLFWGLMCRSWQCGRTSFANLLELAEQCAYLGSSRSPKNDSVLLAHPASTSPWLLRL